MLNDLPREKLKFIIEEYGRSAVRDVNRCRELLRELAPEHLRETNLLLLVLTEGFVWELTAENFASFAQRLHDEFGTQQEFAFWAVESWAMALNLINIPMIQKITGEQGQTKFFTKPPEIKEPIRVDILLGTDYIQTNFDDSSNLTRALKEIPETIGSSEIPLLTDNWETIVSGLRCGRFIKELAKRCVLEYLDETECRLNLDSEFQFLLDGSNSSKLESALRDLFRKPLKLSVVVKTTAVPLLKDEATQNFEDMF
jgi:hypothetical protein